MSANTPCALVAYNRKDAFYKKAKKEGYRSRAAYKLLELNHSWHFLRSGTRVIDLGSWPGGWVQVAAKIVTQTGRVIGIDLVKLDPLSLAHVTLVQGDATDQDQQQSLLSLLGQRADVILSDMAPKLSGVREADEARATALCHTALSCSHTLLKPGGSLLLKVFMNDEYQPLLAELHAAFSHVKTSRPQATRKGSTEVYILATDKKNMV